MGSSRLASWTILLSFEFLFPGEVELISVTSEQPALLKQRLRAYVRIAYRIVMFPCESTTGIFPLVMLYPLVSAPMAVRFQIPGFVESADCVDSQPHVKGASHT